MNSPVPPTPDPDILSASTPQLISWLQALLRLVENTPSLDDDTLEMLWSISYELNRRREQNTFNA